MITLLQLGAELGDEFFPADSPTFSASPVTGVHISELEDPTTYLEGGELLLTTGMPFGHSATASLAYMQRLRDKEVRALGLGLGPWLDEVPQHVIDACRQTGVELGIVPDGAPFQSVSRAYWRLSARDDTVNLMSSLGTQTALARAAIRSDAINAVVRGLAQALGGWAAFLPDDPQPATVYPASAQGFVPMLRQESLRFPRTGMPSASTFGINGQAVVLYPILAGTRIHGFLGVGSGRTLTKADRQIIMTVCMLLSLRARQRELMVSTNAALGTATAKLLLHGQPESARLVAEEAGMDELPSRVRVLALSLDDETEVRTVIQALGALPAGAALPPVAEAAARCQLRFTDGGVLYLLLDEAQLGKSSAAAPGQDPEPSAGDTARNLRAVLSAPLTLAELPANLPALRQNLSGAPAGELSDAGADFDASAQTWVEALAAYTRADLLSAVTQYLRHRGHWEDASRALGIHRNSLRHRITVAGDLLGIDLDDPDVSASLWLALRRNQG